MSQRESYIITERCIACGTCLAVCRAGCIAGGRPPFVIRENWCTGCGECAARCPVGAIRPRQEYSTARGNA